MEYWSLEQAKLGSSSNSKLQGKVAVITGGAGAIGEGVAVELRKAGAEVVLLDISAERLEQAAARVGAFAQVADVTNSQSMEDAVRAVCARFGGIDILVPNAGLATVSPIYETDPDEFRRLVEVNQTGAFITIQAGARVMRSQGRGGSIVLISSKNVAAPGADFSAYSSSKAGMHQLGRVSAIELAADGIRVNMICPDAVFQHQSNPSGLWAEVGPARAHSKGLAAEELEEHYRQRNLLKTTVSAADVGRAVLFFAACSTPTTGASLPVDGGIAGAI
jgi:NAD(P)-dependent dehydrogenase (short-subunit alcohol dehydrogenase family)